jgi:carbon storage regulator
MLVLSRKVNEKVIIGNGITLTVVQVDGNRVKLGIDAPRAVSILREELLLEQDQSLVGAEVVAGR